MAGHEKVGRVVAYVAARLVPKAGATLTAEEITLDYQRWCRANGAIPLRDGPFREGLAQLAQRIDLRSEANDADIIYRDVVFAEP